MSYYEDLLRKRGMKLTDEQVSIRNAWFVSQHDKTRRLKPITITPDLSDPTLKLCSHCEDIKPMGEFHKDKSKKDGRDVRCKACKSRRAARRWNEYANESTLARS